MRRNRSNSTAEVVVADNKSRGQRRKRASDVTLPTLSVASAKCEVKTVPTKPLLRRKFGTSCRPLDILRGTRSLHSIPTELSDLDHATSAFNQSCPGEGNTSTQQWLQVQINVSSNYVGKIGSESPDALLGRPLHPQVLRIKMAELDEPKCRANPLWTLRPRSDDWGSQVKK